MVLFFKIIKGIWDTGTPTSRASLLYANESRHQSECGVKHLCGCKFQSWTKEAIQLHTTGMLHVNRIKNGGEV